jgi:HlyD family secretion protein
MQPTIPTFIDVRSREELQAAVAAADAAIVLAEAEIRRIEAALAFSRDELQRAQTLSRSGTITAKALEKAQLDVTTNEAALASAKAQLGVRRSERTAIAARLIDPASVAPPSGPNCCIQIRAPVTGRVLKIVQDSEAAVPAGAPLIEIGDPVDLEVIADLLSTDAVQVRPGALVKIDGWGGAPLKGQVTRVDPAGFLKVSALGIEEQRVRTTIDFAEPSDAWSRLGHDYRVIVHVQTWSAEDVLTVPVGALFRTGSDWAVYAVKGGRARTTVVRIGHRNAQTAEVLSGLVAGDRVVLHPSDRVRDGFAVAQREIR